MISTVIYDLDGTLVDSVESFVNSYREALGGDAECGRFEDVMKSLGGINEYGVIKSVVGENWKSAIERFNALEDAHLPKLQTFPSIRDGLLELCANGVSQFLVTGKSRRNAGRIIDRFDLDSFFESIKFGDEEHPSKSEHIRDLIREFKLLPEETVYLGDTRSDVDAAQAAGVVPIICTWGQQNAWLNYDFDSGCLKFDRVRCFVEYVLNGRKEDAR